MEWLNLYNNGKEFLYDGESKENALTMFKKMLETNRNSPLLHYYGSTFTGNDVDFQSDVLSTAIMNETKKRGIKLEKNDKIAFYMQNTPVKKKFFFFFISTKFRNKK